MMKRWQTAGGSVLLLMASCIDRSPGYFFASIDLGSGSGITVRDTSDGPVLSVQLVTYIDSDASFNQLDSALVVVNGDGQSFGFPDPDIEATGFPISAYGDAVVTLEVPSPFDDLDTFDAFCSANQRTVDVTLRFYSETLDVDVSEPPPISEAQATIPLTLKGQAPVPAVFASLLGPSRGASGWQGPLVSGVTKGANGSLLFVVSGANANEQSINGSFAIFRADRDSISNVDAFGTYSEPPRVSDSADGDLYVAGRAIGDTLEFSKHGSEFSKFLTISPALDPAPTYDALRVASIAATATGLRAVVQSSYGLIVDPAIEPSGLVSPPADKYYGSFVLSLAASDAELSLTQAEVQARDVLSILDLADGGTLVASTELPPRSSNSTLRVERFDDLGALVWTHDEPGTTYAVDAQLLADESVVFTYEGTAPSGIIGVVRLAALDGSELYRASFAGSGPSIARRADDGALVSFVGTVTEAPATAQIALPTRNVPLLAELDATGAVVRAAQVACGGSGFVGNSENGSAVLVGAFAERFTVGDASTDLDIGMFAVAGID